MEAVLAVLVVVIFAGGMHLLGWRVGRRRGHRLKDPRTRSQELRWLRRLGGIAALAALVVMVWANAGERSMNAFGWVRYGGFVAFFVGVVAWAHVALRRSR
jgi:hypothetical protein